MKLNINEEITSMDLNDKIIASLQANMYPGCYYKKVTNKRD